MKQYYKAIEKILFFFSSLSLKLYFGFPVLLFWCLEGLFLPSSCIITANLHIFSTLRLYIRRKMRKHSIPNFIQKAWEMLDDQSNRTIVDWCEDGSSFQILEEGLFAEELLPKYFRHSNIASFLRQLNMYNFHKRKTAKGLTQFYHKLFRKNHPQLLSGIRRKPSQAEMEAADQLIRKLAPECIQRIESQIACEENSETIRSQLKNEETIQNIMAPESTQPYCLDYGQMWILTPMLVNAFPWATEKKMKTNIIIQGNCGQNYENMGYQFMF